MSYYDYIHNIINNQAFLNTESGIVFEFTAAQASQTYTGVPIEDNLGFNDVSAIAVYNIASSVLNKLFYFQLSGALNTSTISSQIIKYGINTTYLFDVIYSESLLTATNFGLNRPITLDYITYLAYSLSGTTNTNIFSNKGQLIQAVKNMDSSFNNIINQNIALCGINNSNPFLSSDLTNPFVHSSKQLVTGMINIAATPRKEVFLNDLTSQSATQTISQTQNIYWVPFHKGDILSVLINYLSNSSNIQARSYKILLKCESNFYFPPNVSNVGYNSNGNLDPFYLLQLINTRFNSNLNLDASFVEVFNTNLDLPIFREIGTILNPLDLYYKTFLSNIRQPSIVQNGLINNGINPSFQYIYLNSTITTILYPSLRKIKESLITSPYNQYPTLNDIDDIQCDLNNSPLSSKPSNFIIRIYTRPVYTGIDNSFNPNDTFYGNYYDSSIFCASGYNTYHLDDLFTSWTTLINTSYNQNVCYSGGLQNLQTLGEQQLLSICILTYDINANIGIKNIIVTYK
jgi:hypothetical protein